MAFRSSDLPRLKRLLARFHWTTWFMLALGIWALPRLLPHVGALVNVTARDRSTPVFTVRTLADSVIASPSLRGRVVLVNVWATWCLPCRAEMPLLEATWNRHKAAGLVVLGASVDKGDPQSVRDFISERGISYPIAIVGPDVIGELGGVRGYPTSILIGRDGRVRHRVMGPIGPLTLEPAIRRALAERLTTPNFDSQLKTHVSGGL
ncbi:TlpA family protein disulfide reductase [Gemmatimonas groenlandica]|uniref:TlpA family protein disulfide reductase n=1 Tax=Gemmatimonas groenlandica TaxID=2732249 RepID=A0A6M4IW27_9BACT|nr:TlpA disulfide reductase family protein [Gemmatimonas groenlandica]QJR37082.1 TlpA family protein disulfide reductase [Gemmatimonas groenlandica]